MHNTRPKLTAITWAATAATWLVPGAWATPAQAATAPTPAAPALRGPQGSCPYPEGAYPVYLPDSVDPTAFYECNNQGRPVQFGCPQGLDFNPSLNVCDWPSNAGRR